MRADLPWQVETRSLLPDGILYVLPPRQLGKFRGLGLIAILIGLLIAGGVGLFAVDWIREVVDEPDGGDAFDVVFLIARCLFSLPFLVASLALFVIGCFILRGHAEFSISRAKIEAVERCGPFRWRQTRQRTGASGVTLCSTALKKSGRAVSSGPLGGTASIRVDFERQQRIFLAPVYPLELLEPLAKKVAAELRLDLAQSDSTGIGLEPTASRLRALHDSRDDEPPGELPPESDIKIERYDDGLTITVPPVGIRKGGKGMFGFGIVWNIFVGIIFAVFLFTDDRLPWFVFLFFATFFAIGIGMLLGAINMGRRRAVLAVVDDSLMILQTGLFGSKRREWHRDDVDRIVCGASGMKVNDVPVMELQVFDVTGKECGLLAGRSNQELRWLAGTLREGIAMCASSATTAK